MLTIEDTFSRINTPTMHELICANDHSLQCERGGGALWYFESILTYFEAAFFAAIRLVGHLAASTLGLCFIFTQSGRDFYFSQIQCAHIDLVGMFTALIAGIYPSSGQDAVVYAILYVDGYYFQGQLSEASLQQTGLDPSFAIIDQFRKLERDAAMPAQLR